MSHPPLFARVTIDGQVVGYSIGTTQRAIDDQLRRGNGDILATTLPIRIEAYELLFRTKPAEWPFASKTHLVVKHGVVCRRNPVTAHTTLGELQEILEERGLTLTVSLARPPWETISETLRALDDIAP